MGTVMHIDNQDFVSKMEGFAIHGVKGYFIYFNLLKGLTDIY